MSDASPWNMPELDLRHMPDTYTEDGYCRDDVTALRRAALVLRARSKKPNGMLLNAFCRTLTDTADKIERDLHA